MCRVYSATAIWHSGVWQIAETSCPDGLQGQDKVDFSAFGHASLAVCPKEFFILISEDWNGAKFPENNCFLTLLLGGQTVFIFSFPGISGASTMLMVAIHNSYKRVNLKDTLSQGELD